MHFQDEADFVTGVYCCQDPIKHFKLRVRLEKVKSSFIPLPESGSGDGKLQSAEEEIEERVFSWQEKVFSPAEVSYYELASNCRSSLEQKYHSEVIGLPKKSRHRNRLYSHPNADEFTQSQGVNEEVIVGHGDKSHLEEAMSQLRMRRGPGFKKIHRGDVHLPLKNLVNSNPTDDFKNESHLLSSTPQTMYILADLSVRESDGDWINKQEYILCSIQYYPEGILKIQPDFTRDKSLPYQIEVDSDSRIVYHYWIEHASYPITEEELSKEREILSKVCHHYSNLRQLNVGSAFELPPRGVSVIHIMGEITFAEDFEYDSVYVHYVIDIPKGWIASDPDKLSGITQTSLSTVNHEKKDVLYFGHLFEVQLTVNMEHILLESASTPCSWPQMLVRVSSVDWWGRHRTEGYGHTILALHPGPHEVSITTWRPLSISPVGELRRFFMGGSPELEDLEYSGIPNTLSGNLLSRHGVHAATSGSVNVRYNVLVVKNPAKACEDPLGLTDAHSVEQKNLVPMSARSVGASTLLSSVDSVVSAFFRARARLQKIKEEIKDDLNSSK
ncbi:Meckel syndrome type 1 protein-like isoform X2 [Ischnura elegans]|uniref:Meckel syndrome type 1 protein-like isoform X2 n=1 Tax=Ischnura elegans TaxID=197161 RepID=UPI001ED8BEF8|nr:Meckel syndrome type 1 protein-like isoform X2 [Ischnura elegans]